MTFSPNSSLSSPRMTCVTDGLRVVGPVFSLARHPNPHQTHGDRLTSSREWQGTLCLTPRIPWYRKSNLVRGRSCANGCLCTDLLQLSNQ
jgi:hypothetical protein